MIQGTEMVEMQEYYVLLLIRNVICILWVCAVSEKQGFHFDNTQSVLIRNTAKSH